MRPRTSALLVDVVTPAIVHDYIVSTLENVLQYNTHATAFQFHKLILVVTVGCVSLVIDDVEVRHVL